jgi:hypothetical protein
MGSNIKFDYKKEMHMGTQPRSARELYNQVYMNRKAISGVNFAQRDAVKAQEVLNTYSRQSPNKPVSMETNPIEVEEKQQEAKDEKKEELKQNGVQSGAGSIVQQGEAIGKVIMSAGLKELGLQ